MHTHETYLLESGAFGYRIYAGDALRIEQYIAPGLSGFVLMSEAEATAYAQADIAVLDAPVPDLAPDDAK